MKYLTIGAKRRGKMTVDVFSGGINRRDIQSELRDDQLADAENFWLSHGVLRTRPALRAVTGDTPLGRAVSANNPLDRYVVWQQDGRFCAGEVLADGHVLQNPVWQNGEAGVRVPFDVATLPEWTDGAGDGTILFLKDGTPLAPLSGGGYCSLLPFLYVPKLISGGVGAASMFDPPPIVTITEERNLLTSAFCAGFTTDGTGKYFYLPVKKLDFTKEIVVEFQRAEGGKITHTIEVGEDSEKEAAADGLRMYVSPFHRCVFFTNKEGEITAPEGVGISDNLTVYAHADGGDPSLVGKMTLCCWFGGTASGLTGGTRLFLAGNPKYPHRVYWSDTENPLYFPENNYMSVGDTTGAVTAFGKQGKMLVIFKEHELYAVNYNFRAADAEMPSMGLSLTPLHGEIGCDCPATLRLCHNRLVWADTAGRVYMLAGDNAYNQCNVRRVSGPVETYLKAKGGEVLRAASAACFDGWYLLLTGEEILLLRYADTVFERVSTSAAGGDAAQNGMVWYRWTLPEGLLPQRVVHVAESAVLLDTAGVGYSFGGHKDLVFVNGNTIEQKITAHLATKLYDFGYVDTCKRVREITLEAGSTTGCQMRVSYVGNKGTHTDCYEIMLQGASETDGGFFKLCRFTPHGARVRYFGLQLQVTGDVVIGTTAMRYDIDNAVQKGG